jgi:membrane-bound lytic murein transglycosylase B
LAFVAATAILAAAPAHAEDCGKNGEGFGAWLASFKEVAVKDGLSRRAVDAALDGVSYDPTVKRHDGGAATTSPASPQLTSPREWSRGERPS